VLHVGVLAVGLAGSVIARLRPAGMARAMAASAFAQVAVPVIAPISGAASTALAWSPEALVLTGLFAAMWLLSAWLFRKAAT
jgi:hypothetical protein